jgi:hypothetical protein
LPVGETLTVLGDPQVADGGGTPLVVSRRAPGIRGGGQVDFEMPTSRFEPGTFAYYTVSVAFDWQGYTGGGWVAVERSGVELERCRAEFGTRFEHTFHVGVIDPADEEYVEVLASPVGDPGLDGFDEAPDGQTLQNLRITWELVDVPRVPVEPDEGVQPWAWYRGDDLEGADGADLTEWLDRSGNDRHLDDPSSEPGWGDIWHQVARGAFDGQDAQIARMPGRSLQSTFSPYDFASGVTIVQAAGLTSWNSWILGTQQNSGVELYGWDNTVNVQTQGWHGYGEGDLPGYVEGEPVVVVVQLGPDVVEMWANGTRITSWDFLTVRTAAEWQADPMQPGWMLIDGAPAGQLAAEYIVFDGLVDPDADPVDFGADGVQTLHDYLACRYPSLFGGA